jgi:hypothetical protein
MELARTRSAFALATGFVVLATALFALWVGTNLGGSQATLWMDDAGSTLAAAIAAIVCLFAAARHRGRMRAYWVMFGCALGLWAFAEGIWSVYALVLHEAVPSPSWADVGYLGAIPMAVAALVVHPSKGGTSVSKTRSVLDAMVLASALLFLSWALVLGPLWRQTDLSTSAGIVTLAYPFGDIVIVFFAVLAIRGMSSHHRLSLWCLLGALLVMAFSDSVYTYMTEVAQYSSASASLLDTGWFASYLGIGLAAFVSSPRTIDVRPHLDAEPTLASLVVPMLPVLGALGVAGVMSQLGAHLDHTAWVMALGLVGLVLLRQALTVIEFLRSPSHTTPFAHAIKYASAAGPPARADDPVPR